MYDLREGLVRCDSSSAKQIIYNRAFKYYCRCAFIRIVVILVIAVVGLTGVVCNATNPTMLSRLVCYISVAALFLQAVTLPDGTVSDRMGNRIDLYSGNLVLNIGSTEVREICEKIR